MLEVWYSSEVTTAYTIPTTHRLSALDAVKKGVADALSLTVARVYSYYTLQAYLLFMYDLTKLKQAIEDATEHFRRELAGIRTGKAAPAILDGITVDAYGTNVPLQQVATITIEDARTLRVAPWDNSQVHAVEHALQTQNLGLSLSTDEKGVRVSFPELTSDRREQLVKLTHTKLEEARATLRQERDRVWQDIQKQEKEKSLSEDEKFRAKDAMEKIVREGNDVLDEMTKRKETELAA